MISLAEVKLIELVQTGGMGALFGIIAFRYIIDFIFAKKKKREDEKGQESRDQYRMKLDQMQSSIDEIKGNIEMLASFIKKNTIK